MNDLSRWKAALEARGFFVFDDEDTDHEPSCGYIAVYGSEEDWESEKPPQYGCLCDNDDDHPAAEFISRVTAKVFGEWAHFAPLYAMAEEDFYDEWELRKDDEGIGSGPTKLAALLDALEDKTNG